MRVLGALALAAALSSTAWAAQALTDWRDGIATFYGGAPDHMNPDSPSYGTADGSCGFGYIKKSDWPYWSVGALATSNMNFKSLATEGCGACFEITCQDKYPYQGHCNSDPSQRTVTIQITDKCPECGADHIDLQARVFEKIGDPSKGRIAIQYRRVECTPPGNIIVHLDNYSGMGWIRLQVANVAGLGTVKQVSVKGADSDWSTLNNSWGATWEAGWTPKPPLSFKFQSEDGQEVVASNVLQWGSGAGDYDTGIQFSAGGGSSSSNGGGNSSSSTSSSAPSGSLGSSDSPAPSSPAPSPSPPSTGSSPSGLPFSPENYVTHLDQVFAATRSSASSDATATATTTTTVEQLKSALAQGVVQDSDPEAAQRAHALEGLAAFWQQLVGRVVIPVGFRSFQADLSPQSSSLAKDGKLIVLARNIATQQHASKRDPMLSQGPQPDQADPGIVKTPIVPLFTDSNSSSSSSVKVTSGKVTTVGNVQTDLHFDPASLSKAPSADTRAMVSKIDVGGVQVRAFAGAPFRSFAPGAIDVKLDALQATKNVTQAVQQPASTPASTPAAQKPTLLALLAQQNVPDMLKMLDLTPNLRADLASLSSANLGFTLLVPPNTAFASLDPTLTASRKYVEYMMYSLVLGQPLSLKQIAEMDSVTTLEGSDIPVRKEGDRIFLGKAEVVTGDIEASNGFLHTLTGNV